MQQIGRDAHVGNAGGVDLARVHERWFGGVIGAHLVEQGLDVACGKPSLTDELGQRLVCLCPLEEEKPLLDREPQAEARFGTAEVECELASLAGTRIERGRDPLPRPDGAVERQSCFFARERRRDLEDLCGCGIPERQDLFGHAGEAERGEGLLHLGRIEGRPLGIGQVDVERGVRADGRHLAAEEGIIDMCPQVLAHLALDLVGMSDDLVEAAVLHDQGAGLLGADARDARDVVGRVALEAVEIRHELGGNPVVEVLDGLRGHDLHVRHALVGGDDMHVLG